MRSGRDQQSLSYALRLPDDLQTDALRLLDLSREVINLTVTGLWDRLERVCHPHKRLRLQTGRGNDHAATCAWTSPMAL